MPTISSISKVIQLGQIWEINYPYDDGTNFKSRPAMVVGWSASGKNQDDLVLVVSITSHSNGGVRRIGELDIPNPAEVGLSKEDSVVRARNVYSISSKLFQNAKGPLGTMPSSVVADTLSEIANLFNPQSVKLIPKTNT